jgi:hypothetical protein
MSSNSQSQGLLYLVVCAAPAAAGAGAFVHLAQRSGWLVRVIATPLGMRFIDAAALATLTGDRVRSEYRMPTEPDELPPADAVVVAPATFNTVNKWAAGITDTFAAGLLCELTGPPAPGNLDAASETGRGLGLVEVLSQRWGHCGGRHGRTVWFELTWI